ncbi:MAG: T9SS type A sorting domain-containing protein [Saprospiraceae bacterium]|nr:T9SS type A sorting domain-containing protein [Saprospiraceae bacterium]
MKTFTATFFFLLISIFIFSQTKHNIRFMLDGHLRESIVVVPGHTPPSDGYPLVMMLHGTSGDGEKFYNISGWKELGEQENFVTVFPSSLKWCFTDEGIEKYNSRWVNGNLTENPCSGPPQDYVDDVKFLKFLVQKIKDSILINPKKVFVSGFSNGCAMVHKLANEAGDVFAAAAGTSGGLTQSDSSRPVNRIPLWHVVGNLDDRFYNPPRTEVPYGRDTILAYLKSYFVRVLACQGLTENFTFSETPINHTYSFAESMGQEQSQPFIFTLVKGMTHQYPNGDNFPISAPVLFWNFFNQVTSAIHLTGTANKPDWKIYPNPASSELYISYPSIKSVRGYSLIFSDISGKVLFYKDNITYPNFTIPVHSITPGLYCLRIIDEDVSVVKKVQIIFNGL